MRIKRFTISIAFFLLSIFVIKGAVGFSMSCFSTPVNIANNSVPANQPDDAEKAPEEKNLLAEEYIHSFHPVALNHPISLITGMRKAVRNTYIPQAVYLSIPEPPPNVLVA